MGWIDIENELSEYSRMLTTKKLNAKKYNTILDIDSLREEYDELKSSLKCYLQEETKRAFGPSPDNPAKRVIEQLPADSKIISFNLNSLKLLGSSSGLSMLIEFIIADGYLSLIV